MEENIKYIVLALTKAVKALHIYGKTHPTFRNFYVSFYEKLKDFLQNDNELSFQIERFSILHSDRAIYEEKEDDISIAFRLFQDGIRNIGFTKGLTSEELLLFLEMLSQPPQEKDIALGLLESDFAHIDFYVVEEEEETISYQIPDAPAQNVDYEARINEMMSKEQIDVNMVFTKDLNVYELNKLKTEIQDEEKRNIVPLAIKILIDFLSTEKSQEVVDSLIELLEQCIDKRDFYNARKIINTLQGYPDINVMEKFENQTMILGFRDLLTMSQDGIFNEFITFLDFFSKKSLPYLVKMIAILNRGDRLEALRQKIAHIAENDPAPIAVFLNSEDVTTVINATAILGTMRSKQAVSYLQPLMFHAEPMVRAEVLLALKNMGESSMIAKFLDDSNSDVRMKALHVLSQMKYPNMYSELLRRVKKEDFLNLELVEQTEYFNHLVANGDKNLTDELKGILFKKLSLFSSKEYRVMRKLAATGLSQIPSEEALKILQQGAQDRNKDIKLACEMALRWK